MAPLLKAGGRRTDIIESPRATQWVALPGGGALVARINMPPSSRACTVALASCALQFSAKAANRTINNGSVRE